MTSLRLQYGAVEGPANGNIGDPMTVTGVVGGVSTALDLAALPTTHAAATIAGTSDAPAGSVVRVQVDGQTLTTTVGADGTWSVTATALADGSYPVSVEVTDGAGNSATATATLVVDATPRPSPSPRPARSPRPPRRSPGRATPRPARRSSSRWPARLCAPRCWTTARGRSRRPR